MKQPKKLSDLLSSSNNEVIERFVKKEKYIKHDFQELGFELSSKLNDNKHKSLYMRLAKNTAENLLRIALSFALDYPMKYGNERGKIFMWKLSELKKIDKSNKNVNTDTNTKKEI
jgi:mannitol-1-phosphate/altronate dehydrogenase